MLIINWK